MTKFRTLALALAILMVLPLVFASGCAKGNDPGSDVNVIEETADENSVYDAEIKDLGGHVFRFAVGNTTENLHLAVNEVYAEEVNGDKINDAVFRRNAGLQEDYNCVIEEDRIKDLAAAIKEQLLAGEYQYDFIYYSVKQLRTLSASGLLADLGALENIDLDKAWWDQNAVEGFSIAGKKFYATGAAGTLDERASWVIYFNKDFVDMAELESPYELVRQGKWTVDKMYEYVLATSEDKDGNGIMEITKDRFGYMGEAASNWFHVAAGGIRLSKTSSSGNIEIPPTVNKEVLSAWTTLKPLLTTEYRDVSDWGPRFRQGLATFFSCNLGAVANMANSNVNFGLLPMPKLSEDQEEYWTSLQGGWCYVYAIPNVVENATDYQANGFSSGQEQAAYFLEAFAYRSMGVLDVAYYDQVVKHQAVRDEDSVEMLDIGLKNKVYDPVVIFDFGKIGMTLFRQVGSNGEGGTMGTAGVWVKGSDANYDTLVSTYQSRVEAARKQLNSYIDYVTSDDD